MEEILQHPTLEQVRTRTENVRNAIGVVHTMKNTPPTLNTVKRVLQDRMLLEDTDFITIDTENEREASWLQATTEYIKQNYPDEYDNPEYVNNLIDRTMETIRSQNEGNVPLMEYIDMNRTVDIGDHGSFVRGYNSFDLQRDMYNYIKNTLGDDPSEESIAQFLNDPRQTKLLNIYENMQQKLGVTGDWLSSLGMMFGQFAGQLNPFENVVEKFTKGAQPILEKAISFGALGAGAAGLVAFASSPLIVSGIVGGMITLPAFTNGYKLTYVDEFLKARRFHKNLMNKETLKDIKKAALFAGAVNMVTETAITSIGMGVGNVALKSSAKKIGRNLVTMGVLGSVANKIITSGFMRFSTRQALGGASELGGSLLSEAITKDFSDKRILKDIQNKKDPDRQKLAVSGVANSLQDGIITQQVLDAARPYFSEAQETFLKSNDPEIYKISDAIPILYTFLSGMLLEGTVEVGVGTLNAIGKRVNTNNTKTNSDSFSEEDKETIRNYEHNAVNEIANVQENIVNSKIGEDMSEIAKDTIKRNVDNLRGMTNVSLGDFWRNMSQDERQRRIQELC